MKRMRTVVAAVVVGILVSALAGAAGASERPPMLQSTPKAKLGTKVVLVGLFFAAEQPATLYLEAGKTRKQLATAHTNIGGQLSFTLRLPKTAPANAHLLVCQNRCASRVRLALAH